MTVISGETVNSCVYFILRFPFIVILTTHFFLILGGPSWGDHGYIKMKRGVSKHGICGIAMQPSYPFVGKELINLGQHWNDPVKDSCENGDEDIQTTGTNYKTFVIILNYYCFRSV